MKKIHDMLCSAYDKFITTSFYRGIKAMIESDFEYRITRSIQFQLATFAQHQKTFPQFRNVNFGKDVVIVACGPSVNDFVPIDGAIYIGLNRAVRFDKVKLDYWFMQDFFNSTREEKDLYINYKGNDCKKFYGIGNFTDMRRGTDKYCPSESDIYRARAYKYYHDHNTNMWQYSFEFAYDISTMPLANFGSIVFPALQFALWTNPKRIFLVGCDCTPVGHFYSKSDITNLDKSDNMYRNYSKLKDFAHAYYPETEIISINPVGLKGLFRDWYQKDGPLT